MRGKEGAPGGIHRLGSRVGLHEHNGRKGWNGVGWIIDRGACDVAGGRQRVFGGGIGAVAIVDSGGDGAADGT